MDEDHFAHSILPPRPPSKRPFQIVIAAVILIAAAILVIVYWPLLSLHFMSQNPSAPAVESAPQRPATTEEKQTLYQSAAATDQTESSTSLSVTDKQNLLKSTVTSGATASSSAPNQAPAPSGGLSAEEKQKLFQSTQ